MSNEVTDSFSNLVKKRLTTPIYGTFLMFWVVFHWKFLVAIFFADEEMLWKSQHILKNEYLEKLFFNYRDPCSYVLWILPFVLTFFAIWKFPKWFLLPAFKKEEEYKVEKKKIRLQEENKIIREQRLLEEEDTKKLETSIIRERKEKEVEKENPKILWEKQYQKLKETKHFRDDFWIIKELMFKNNGSIDQLATIINSEEAIDIVKDYIYVLSSKDIFLNDSNNLFLTDKGKYIMSRYIEDIQNIGAEKLGFKTGVY